MEFDKNTHEPEDQILDAERKLTINPISREDQIQSEQSTSGIAAAHANGPAIGNFAGDIEATGSTTAATPQTAEQRAAQLLAQHKASNPTKTTKFPVALVGIVIMIGVLLFALLYR